MNVDKVQMDRHMGGFMTDGQMDGQTDGWTDRQTSANPKVEASHFYHAVRKGSNWKTTTTTTKMMMMMMMNNEHPKRASSIAGSNEPIMSLTGS